jgi:nitrogen fixation/metabolism regulation signal transduction histidine kinase
MRYDSDCRSAPPPGAGRTQIQADEEGLMSKRKQYVVDKKFQLKTTFSILGMIVLAGIIIVSSIGISIAVNNERLNNVVVIHSNIVDALLTYAQEIPGAGDSAAIKNASKVNAQNIETINKILFHNNLLLLVIVGVILCLSIVTFFMLIKLTHRISGPVMVISGYLRQIIDGKLPHVRQLREDDELKDLNELVKEMVAKLKERENK